MRPRCAGIAMALISLVGQAVGQAPLSDGQADTRNSAPVAIRAENEAFLGQYAETYRFSLGRPRGTQITPDGSAVLFLRSPPRSFVQDLYEFDCRTREERVLLTAEQILAGEAEQLSAEEKARRERLAGNARDRELRPLGGRPHDPRAALRPPVRRQSRVRQEPRGEISSAGFPLDPTLSPDAAQLACVRGGEIFVTDLATGREHQLTSGAGGHDHARHGRVRGPGRNGPLPRLLVVARQPPDRLSADRHGGPGDVPYSRPAAAAKRAQHVALSAPGQEERRHALGIVPAAGGETTWVNWDREKFPYLASRTWEKNSPLTIVVQNRNQTEEIVYAVDEQTGALTELFHESDPAWINLGRSSARNGSGRATASCR